MKTLKSLTTVKTLSVLAILFIVSGCSNSQRIDTLESTKQLILTCEDLDKQRAIQALKEFDSGMCKAHVEIGKDYMLLCDRLRFIKDSLK